MVNITKSLYDNLTARIFSLQSGDEKAFEAISLEIFKLQYQSNPVYHSFVDALKISIHNIHTLKQIPFLPIQFFKTKAVLSNFGILHQPVVFSSSGTTQSGNSHHTVQDIRLYEKSFLKTFQLFFGDISSYCVLALLPSYLEKGGSSLVYMAEKLIQESAHPKSAFYLHNHTELIETIDTLKSQKQKTLLLGVSYALLDLAEKAIQLPDFFSVMETGGMKGKRKEMLKEELHATLREQFATQTIFSEYGMTELLSQAYSLQEGIFRSPPWMKILLRDTNDPFHYVKAGRTGGINVIDLANLNSCCFIATQDLGKQHGPEGFELMGRFDNSDLRGCNLLVS